MSLPEQMGFAVKTRNLDSRGQILKANILVLFFNWTVRSIESDHAEPIIHLIHQESVQHLEHIIYYNTTFGKN